MKDNLDLRHNGVLPIALAKRLTKISNEVRKEYTDYVGELAKANGISGIDWLIGVTCRNPFQTKVFDNLCKLKLLESCIRNKEIVDTVIVEDKGMYHAVHSLSKKHEVSLTINILPNNYSYSILIQFRSLLVSLYLMLISIVVPRFFVKGAKAVPLGSIIYLDTYAKPQDFSEEGFFSDYYYSGLTENIPERVSEKVWYVPVLYSIRSFSDLKWIIDKSRKSSRNFLIMDEWLNLSDYFYSLYISLRLPKKIKRIPLFQGVDISSMITRELLLDVFSLSLIRTVLIYRFVFRLKYAGIDIERVIDWNENQVVDRALNLGVRCFYLETPVIGYQGYIVSDYYLSHSPSCYEVEAKTIPDIIFTGCASVVDRKREFFKSQKVSVAPAFRFQELLGNRLDCGKVEKKFFLVALPYNIDTSESIINACLEWSKFHDIKFVVKKHPAISKEVLFSRIGKLSLDCFELSDASLYALFNHSLMMLSSDSSACFEAVACGVHVIIMGSVTGPTSNPLLGIVDSNCWDVCYDAACMQNVYENKSNVCDVDLTSLLVPLNENSIMNFLGY